MNKQDLHKQMLGRVRGTEKAKKPHKANWLLNEAFRSGNQWLDWNANLGMFRDVTLGSPAWQVKIVENQFQPVGNVIAAKLTQNRPGFRVTPGNDNYRSRQKARVGTRLIKYTWEWLDLQAKVHRAAQWMVTTGIGWLAVYWDADKGDAIRVDGEVVGKYGAPRVDVVSPHDIGIDPLADDFESAAWAYRQRAVSVEWVKEMLNANVEADATIAPGLVFDPDDTRVDKVASRAIQDDEIHRDLDIEMVELWEYYDLVRNKVYYFTRDRIIYEADWDLDMPFIPLIMQWNNGEIRDFKMTAGSIYGETPMTQIRPLQMELNKRLSQTIDAMNLTANPRLLATKSARINKNTYETAPGSVVEWSGQGRIEPLRYEPLPNSIFKMIDDTRQQMYNITGVHEVSQGEAPGSIQSARGVALLADLDATRWGPTARMVTSAIRQLVVRLLQVLRKYGTEESLGQIVGQAQAFDLWVWLTEALSSFDVDVEPGSTLASSKAMRDDMILRGWQLGLLKDPKEVRKMLEFGDEDDLMGDMDEDRLCQKREIAEVMANPNNQIQVKPWDDHFAHMDELEVLFKAPDYQTFPEPSRKVLEAHWMDHNQAVVQINQQNQQAAMQRGVAASGAMGGQQGGGAANKQGQMGQDPGFGNLTRDSSKVGEATRPQTA